MTAKEKEKIEVKMIKNVFRIAGRHELWHRDLVLMVLDLAACIVRYCIREGVEGCKKNSRKVSKLAVQTFTDYINRDTKDDSWWLKDDEEDNEKAEEDDETEE